MARGKNTVVENNFIKGLITEATSLNFPENACVETYDCVFHLKGEVSRRYGINFEPEYSTKLVDGTNAVTTFLWQNAAGQADKNFLVVQAGGILYFYTVTDNQAVSANLHATTLDFTLAVTSTVAEAAATECQFAFGQGYLFLVNPHTEPQYVSYDPTTDSLSIHSIQIQVRDTEGIEDGSGTGFDSRPATLTNLHQYNLYNQGWAPTATANYINSWRQSGGLILAGTVGAGRTDYPSNADVWWLYKNASDNFDTTLIDKNTRGNTPAPKGHYIYNAFNLDRIGISGIAGLPVETSGNKRPKVVAFHASRVWYTGTEAQGYSNKIYFSQVAKDQNYFGRCYQLNDPTNEFLFSLLATDGGVINIQDCGSILKMVSLQSSLLVFATNGIWSISGNQGIGFSPEDFTIRKVSSIPSISSDSFVDVDGFPMWWNNDGIYTVSGANAVGSIAIDSLTETTIKKFYNDIPTANKMYVRGAYNPLLKQVIWLYRSFAVTDFIQNFEFDRALIYNTITKAFFPWTFPNRTVKVNGIIAPHTLGTAFIDVVSRDSEGHYILDEHQELIVTRELQSFLQASVFKFLCSSTEGTERRITFSEVYDTDFTDFISFDTIGNTYNSYLITGYKIPGEANKKAQDNYVTVYIKNEDSPALFFQGIWNFGTSVASGYYGVRQHLQFPEALKKSYHLKKLKVRGNGTCLQLKFSSSGNNPFVISGWSRFETINQQP